MSEQDQESPDTTICDDNTCPMPVEPKCVDGVCELPNGQICSGGICELPPQKSIQDWIKWAIILIGIPLVAFLIYHFYIKNKNVTTSA